MKDKLYTQLNKLIGQTITGCEVTYDGNISFNLETATHSYDFADGFDRLYLIEKDNFVLCHCPKIDYVYSPSNVIGSTVNTVSRINNAYIISFIEIPHNIVIEFGE